MKFSIRNKIEEYTTIETIDDMEQVNQENKEIVIVSVPEICFELPVGINSVDELREYCTDISIDLYTFLKSYFDI